MDFFSKWGQLSSIPAVSVAESVETLLQQHLQLWWACERSFPTLSITRSEKERTENNRKIVRLVESLIYELKHPDTTPDGWQEQQRRLRNGALPFIRDALNLEQQHLDFIERSGLLEGAETFARMARSFDPHIRAEDIYQASRNVMTMNFLQILLDLPVSVTPSVFAYSMLYPYTDNYLDDPSVSSTTKLAFNHRFQQRLRGEVVRPANDTEATINTLVGMIEEEWDRTRYPQVYDSLLAIHAAQGRSLRLVAPGASPYELDVLGISFEKGGTSVLADGYLVAGNLEPAQAKLMFGYGAFTQLMDDLEDMEDDLAQGSMSIFSQTAKHWCLDGIMNRLLRFGREVFADLNAFPVPAAPLLKDLMHRAVDPLLIDSAGRMGKYFSKGYLRSLEQYFPFHFTALARQRKRLERQKVTLGRLFETFFLQQDQGEA